MQNRRSRAIPVPPGANRCASNLERLLANPDFIKAYCGDDQPRGVKVLYEDPKLGFQVLAHINDKARKSPPHDHGASWAIYGQATKYTDMIEWEREDDGHDPKHAKLKPAKSNTGLMPGQAGIYQDGAIHSIDYPDYARFVRVTGTDLDKINRIKIDLKTGAVEQMPGPPGVVESARDTRAAPRSPPAPQSHARRRRRAGADRRARRTDLLAQSSAVGAQCAAEPAGTALRRAGAAQGDAHRADRRQ